MALQWGNTLIRRSLGAVTLYPPRETALTLRLYSCANSRQLHSCPRSDLRSGSLNRLRRVAFVFLEVLGKQPRQFGRGLVKRDWVGPSISRDQDFVWHIGTDRGNLQAEDGIGGRRSLAERAIVNRVDDRSGVFEAHPFAHAVGAAAPSRVD